jgi:glycosyltransferase involved in cell wall biosynthesis
VDVLDRFFYQKADGMVVVNERFLEIAGIDRADAAVVMNTPSVVGAGPTTRVEAGLFYAGNFDALRDMRYAMPVLKRAAIPVRFAGDGPLHADYEAMARGSDVRLLGRISPGEVFDWTSRCMAVLALYDTARQNNRLASPNKLFDAMKYGKPAIVSDDSVMADIVREHDCGLVVRYGDAAQLEAAIDELRTPHRYRGLCERAYRAFESRYNWERMAPRLLELYERLMLRNAR